MSKKILLTCAFLATTGCGSSSDTESTNERDYENNTGYYEDFSKHKGKESEPELSTDNLDNNSQIPLNTVNIGVVKSNEIQKFTFIPNSNIAVNILLENTGSEFTVLNLKITSDSGTKTHNAKYSELLTGEVYLIEVIYDTAQFPLDENEIKETSYSLTLVEANRETMKLSDTGYLVQFDTEYKKTCNDGSEDLQETRLDVASMDFDSGMYASGDTAYPLIHDVRNTFVYSEEHSLEYTDDLGWKTESRDFKYSVQFNPYTGDFEGSFRDAVTLEYKVKTYLSNLCHITESYTGKIVL